MSYSFSARAKTKADVLAAVNVEFDKVVAAQPVHAQDMDAARGVAATFVALLPDDDTKDVAVTCNGWISTTNDIITGTSVGCQASLVPPVPPVA